MRLLISGSWVRAPRWATNFYSGNNLYIINLTHILCTNINKIIPLDAYGYMISSSMPYQQQEIVWISTFLTMLAANTPEYNYQRAEPTLINGWWSQLAGCRVNVCVLTFCKFWTEKHCIISNQHSKTQIFSQIWLWDHNKPVNDKLITPDCRWLGKFSCPNILQKEK